ncbi:CPBP family glutamic-type intramembrane protease [Clostridium sp. BJN0013]|mgnify:CR=1 FL=1|uniref:type II CAAX prenyl endopeptidase Rce1 family protein n=1 Tax=Clostridium sp. BJN0013 TaxID=3236840 RepID=UPI0034C6A3CB
MGSNSGLPFVMFMKVITGLCFGIIIGFIRYKLKNCYATILIHSFMNIFGR